MIALASAALSPLHSDAANAILFTVCDVILLPVRLFPARCLVPLIAFFGIPFLLALHAGRCTLSSYCRGRHRPPRRRRPSSSLRLRILVASLLTSPGIISPSNGGLGHALDHACPPSARCRIKEGVPWSNSNSKKHKPCSHRTACSFFNFRILDSSPPAVLLPDTLPTGVIDSFLSVTDVLSHFHVLASLEDTCLLTNHRPLSPSHPPFSRILVQARNLQTTLHSCDESSSLQHPSVCVSNRPHELPTAIDTGASCSLTPKLGDFITPLEPPDAKTMEGVKGETSKVIGSGTVSWDIEDSVGKQVQLRTKACSIPDATIRLFSPQTHLQEQPKTKTASKGKCDLRMSATDVCLAVGQNTESTFPIQRGNNPPLMLTHQALHPKKSRSKPHKPIANSPFENLLSFLSSSTFEHVNVNASFAFGSFLPEPGTSADVQPALDPSNWNSTEPQRELPLWHARLGHLGFGHVQTLLARSRDESDRRIIRPSNAKSSSCPICLCQACQCAKQKRRNPPSQKKTARVELEGALGNFKLRPGDRVSVDLCQSPVKGRLPDTCGKEKPDEQHAGGAIFVDHASKFAHHTHQFSTAAAETVSSKHKFETFCDQRGITIEECLADNHPFQSAEWKADCDDHFQHRQHSGVGAHHQNCAERTIQSVFNVAGAMLLHQSLHWPQEAKPCLWPFAVDHATCLWNRTPNQNSRTSPMEIFTSDAFHNLNHLQRLHAFGCPVCVLDPKLQDGKKSPKWERRSRQGVCLGVSPHHSSTVHLVLNPETGKIAPQHHVVFDDRFSSVCSKGILTDSVWDSLVSSNTERHPDASTAPDLVPFHRPTSVDERENPLPTGAFPPTTPVSPTPTPSSALPDTGILLPPSPEGVPRLSEGALPASEGVSPSSEGAPAPSPAPPRRSLRTRKPIDRLSPTFCQSTNQPRRPRASRQVTFTDKDNGQRVTRAQINQQCLASVNWDEPVHLCATLNASFGACATHHQSHTLCDKSVDCLHPMLPHTGANHDDNPAFKEAVSSPDAAGFIRAMEMEIQTLSDLDVCDVVPRPKDHKVTSSVWAFKRKRHPDGSVRKLKARFCARGFEQQQGVDCFETFAPVVVWLTVRLLLIMSILMNPETKQIDCTAAFAHADIDCLVHAEMPKAFEEPGMALKLKKSLHGLAQSPRNFFLHTKKQLTTKFGFAQSNADPCPFTSRDVICLICVDDALLFCKDEAAINNSASKMKEAKVQFREEEDVAGFLGAHIERKDGEIHLTQRGLTERIIEAMHLDGSETAPTETPCANCLPVDEDGPQALGELSHPSVAGQLNCLAGHTRCDTALAASQAARFVHNPKRSHELALIQIGRHLKGTVDEGLILKPSSCENLEVSVCVDAAFASGWGTKCGSNPDSVKSRTGCPTEIANCPVMWVSKLQSTAAASTMESECAALSMCPRAAIPSIAVLRSVVQGLHCTKERIIAIEATVHEDNQGALTLANLEPGRHTPRSKFCALRLHWFRSWIHDPAHKINVEFIQTSPQKADFLTEPLAAVPLAMNRRQSMGW